MQRRTDDTVCALANDILDVILLADVEGDLAGTALRRSARHLVGIGTGPRDGCRSRKRREREIFVGEEVEFVLCRCSATWRGCDRSGRSDGGVKCGLASGVCGGGREVSSSRRESQSVLSQPQVISNAFFPIASRSVRRAECSMPIRPAVHVPR